MAGSKKNKIKKVAAAASLPDPPEIEPVGGSDQLIDDLFSQLDARVALHVPQPSDSSETPSEPRQKQDPKSRFKARQARKVTALEQSKPTVDPETEARLERDAREEEKDINRICDELGLQIHEINPDGHCLFSAIADQLALLGILPPSQANYAIVRQAASRHILSHPEDFLPFLPPPPGEDSPMTIQLLERYCAAMQDTAEWGGEPEIRALSRAYTIPIHVIQAGRPPIVTYNPSDPSGKEAEDKDKRVVRLSYHRRMYGLGEHYNSLRPRSAFSQLSLKVQAILST